MTLMPLAVVNYRWKNRRKLIGAGTQRLLTVVASPTPTPTPPKPVNP